MPYLDPEDKRRYQRDWFAARRAEAMKGEHCAQCGSIDRLELDHIDPTTKVSSNIWSWSKPRREAEIAKCQWLCSACHALKSTLEAGKQPARHGTETMHRNHGCRCADCSRAATEARNARRLRNVSGRR